MNSGFTTTDGQIKEAVKLGLNRGRGLEGAQIGNTASTTYNRLDLEGAVNDAARCASIACTLMEESLTPSSIHQQQEGYKVLMLTEEQFDDLHFIVGEASYRAKKACEAFYGRPI